MDRLHGDTQYSAAQISHPLGGCEGDDRPVLEVLDHWVEFHTPSPNTSSCNKQGTRPDDMLHLQHTTSIDAANFRTLYFLAGTGFKPTTSHDRYAVSSTHNTDRHCQFHGTSHPLSAIDFEPASSHDRHAVPSTHNTDLWRQFRDTFTPFRLSISSPYHITTSILRLLHATPIYPANF